MSQVSTSAVARLVTMTRDTAIGPAQAGMSTSTHTATGAGSIMTGTTVVCGISIIEGIRDLS